MGGHQERALFPRLCWAVCAEDIDFSVSPDLEDEGSEEGEEDRELEGGLHGKEAGPDGAQAGTGPDADNSFTASIDGDVGTNSQASVGDGAGEGQGEGATTMRGTPGSLARSHTGSSRRSTTTPTGGAGQGAPPTLGTSGSGTSGSTGSGRTLPVRPSVSRRRVLALGLQVGIASVNIAVSSRTRGSTPVSPGGGSVLAVLSWAPPGSHAFADTYPLC